VKTKLYSYLKNLGACKDALEWIDDNSLSDPQVAWDTCPVLSWLLWLAARHQGGPGWPTRQELVLAARDCAAYYAAYAIETAGGDGQKALADMADIVRKRLYIGEISL
jgi:hypothetical protein